MKKLFVLFVMSLFVVSASFAQINKNWDGTKPEVYKGSKNFVFMYSPFVSANLGSAPAGSYTNYVDTMNVTTTNMFGVGFQYYVSNEIALAIGLNFGSTSWEPKWAGQTATVSGTAFGVSLDGNYHFKSLYGVSPYLGLNVNFGSNSQTIEVTSGSNTFTQKSTGSAIGFGANFGFDWYFTPGLSLGGKYTLGYGMNSAPERTTTSGGTSTVFTGPKTSGFGTGAASIMLNVHI
jgi:hypothetical protein